MTASVQRRGRRERHAQSESPVENPPGWVDVRDVRQKWFGGPDLARVFGDLEVLDNDATDTCFMDTSEQDVVRNGNKFGIRLTRQQIGWSA
ncbi:hypothetical protein [Ruegeria sp. SCP11]|uniref:hypothetical protein n=1 Tax=Ruegeria sp. SCP11 TaxID=3141378 RepID=UPI003338E5B0